MAYSDFDLQKIAFDFQLEIIENKNIFEGIHSLKVSDFLVKTLERNVSLAQALNTEKARSELIIMNMFLELKQQMNVGIFSGIEFSIDKARGLNGFCDFLISQSSEQLFLKTPVIAVVEAKNENIMGGLGQCIAEMIAAKIFNEQQNTPLTCIYGIVTTGHVWKFMILKQGEIFIDKVDYFINAPDKIMGILAAMVRQEV
jgi:hypothetical protein